MLEAESLPDDNGARDKRRVYGEDEQGIAHAHFAEKGYHLVICDEQQGGKPPGQAKRDGKKGRQNFSSAGRIFDKV